MTYVDFCVLFASEIPNCEMQNRSNFQVKAILKLYLQWIALAPAPENVHAWAALASRCLACPKTYIFWGWCSSLSNAVSYSLDLYYAVVQSTVDITSMMDKVRDVARVFLQCLENSFLFFI